MERGKIVAIITGVISILLAVAYLILVELLDFRGEMLPAPISYQPSAISHWLSSPVTYSLFTGH